MRWMIVVCVLLAAAPGLAQTRPTFSQVESDLAALQAQHAALEQEHADLEALHHATQAAVCTKVELDGDSYRPFFCGGQCGCVDTSTAQGCSETSAGVFELVVLEDGNVDGSCQPGSTTVDRGQCVVQFCSGENCLEGCEDGFLNCTSDPFVCPSGTFCGASGECVYSCDVDADCIDTVPAPGDCTAPVVACSVGADCPGGWSCDTTAGQCAKSGCLVDDQCDALLPVPTPYTLSNVGSLQAPDPATCQGASADLTISSSDALACIAQAEAVIGSSCAYLCGDGEIDPGETCDDGNTTPGDGCDASCQTEP